MQTLVTIGSRVFGWRGVEFHVFVIAFGRRPYNTGTTACQRVIYYFLRGNCNLFVTNYCFNY